MIEVRTCKNAEEFIAVDLPRANSDFVKPLERRGVPRYVEPEQVPETFAGVYDTIRVETPGMFVRTPVWWELRTVRRS